MIRRSWMIGASIETTRELWASSLREVKKRIRPLFAQERAALNAGLFVDGLLGDERRKTGWMRAEAAGDPGPWRQQAVLGRDRWDADVLRDLVRDYATEHLADENAVLVIDETGVLKQGKASCGVARQYTGRCLVLVPDFQRHRFDVDRLTIVLALQSALDLILRRSCLEHPQDQHRGEAIIRDS